MLYFSIKLWLPAVFFLDICQSSLSNPILALSTCTCLSISLTDPTISLTSSPYFPFSCTWPFHSSHSLHASTLNKCMLVLVAPIAMLVSTGLSGSGDLWCSTQSVSAFTPASTPLPKEPYSPTLLSSWSAIDYVSELICMNALCLSSALHLDDEEMLIHFSLRLWFFYDEGWEMHPK